jgi:hypothetical protein
MGSLSLGQIAGLDVDETLDCSSISSGSNENGIIWINNTCYNVNFKRLTVMNLLAGSAQGIIYLNTSGTAWYLSLGNIDLFNNVYAPLINNSNGRTLKLNRNWGSSTGTGSQQTIAHSLVNVPTDVTVTPTQSGATVTWWADGTNIYPTVTNGATFNWSAKI